MDADYIDLNISMILTRTPYIWVGTMQGLSSSQIHHFLLTPKSFLSKIFLVGAHLEDDIQRRLDLTLCKVYDMAAALTLIMWWRRRQVKWRPISALLTS